MRDLVPRCSRTTWPRNRYCSVVVAQGSLNPPALGSTPHAFFVGSNFQQRTILSSPLYKSIKKFFHVNNELSILWSTKRENHSRTRLTIALYNEGVIIPLYVWRKTRAVERPSSRPSGDPFHYICPLDPPFTPITHLHSHCTRDPPPESLAPSHPLNKTPPPLYYGFAHRALIKRSYGFL